MAQALLSFLYTWNYAAFFSNGGGAEFEALLRKKGDDDVALAQALFNIKVYVAADKYGVPELQQQAADAFGSSLFRASSGAAAAPSNSDGSGGNIGSSS